jgi:hypothetical protein
MDKSLVERLGSYADDGMRTEGYALMLEASDRIEALEASAVVPVEPIAEVVAGNYMNRLMWATDEMQENTPVGTKLYAAPLVVQPEKQTLVAAGVALRDEPNGLSNAVQCEKLIRYCPGCGSVGDVEARFRDCCPDGPEARMIPEKLANKCRDTFQIAVRNMISEHEGKE